MFRRLHGRLESKINNEDIGGGGAGGRCIVGTLHVPDPIGFLEKKKKKVFSQKFTGSQKILPNDVISRVLRFGARSKSAGGEERTEEKNPDPAKIAISWEKPFSSSLLRVKYYEEGIKELSTSSPPPRQFSSRGPRASYTRLGVRSGEGIAMCRARPSRQCCLNTVRAGSKALAPRR